MASAGFEAACRWLGRVPLSLGTLAAVSVLTACPKPPVEAVAEHWCPEGFEVGHGDVCFALPATHSPSTGIVVYVHGPMEGRGNAEEWAAVRGAVARGFAVVLPRGRRGLCAWKPGHENQFCWPQEATDPGEAKAVVADWDHTLWQVNELLEGGNHPRYVLAFSEGAHFAAHLAQSGGIKADAFALVGGGTLLPEPATPAHRPPILLLATGRDTEPEKANALAAWLTKERWPHERCTRGGEHALTGADVDTALRFFQRGAGGGFACDGGSRAAPPVVKSAPKK